MVWRITPQQKVAPTVWDPYFLNVSLLLHGDGANGSKTIIDSSSSPKTVTAFGNAQISTAQSKFGGASIAFDGTNDYVQVVNNEFSFTLGTDWTYELWVRPSSSRFQCVIASPIITAYIRADNLLQTYNPSGNFIQSNATVPSGQWTHLAWVVQNNVLHSYVSGTKSAVSYTYVVNQSAATVTIGDDLSVYDQDMSGHIDEVRITKGIARYTANFTPPTAPFPDI